MEAYEGICNQMETRKILFFSAAVAAFCGTLHCGLAGGMNLAVEPLGRQAEVTMQVCAHAGQSTSAPLIACLPHAELLMRAKSPCSTLCGN